MTLRRTVTFLACAAMAALFLAPVRAQVGAKGVQDLNGMPESALAALPGMNAAIAKAFVDKRPFPTIVEANAFLLEQKLTQEQATAMYVTAFIPLNLNTCTIPEILLVPKIANRMRIEFPEYRPWRNFEQFDREIGKYVGADETNRLKQYIFIPINLNTGTDEQFLTIPNMAARMLIEFKEYRPWRSKEQFDREIGKYVGQKETDRLWRYMTIQP